MRTAVAEAILPIVQATYSDFRHAYGPNASNDTKGYDFKSIQKFAVGLSQMT